MWLVFLLLIAILGIIYSRLEIKLYCIDITEKNADFKACISLKFFGIFSLVNFYLNRKEIKFFGKKIPYSKIMTKRELKEFNREALEIFRKFNIRPDKIDFTLKIGLIDLSLTNIAIVVLSSIFPILIKDKVKRKNVKYKILPNYQTFCFQLQGKIKISIKSLTLIKFYLQNIKTKNEHNKSKNYGVKESF